MDEFETGESVGERVQALWIEKMEKRGYGDEARAIVAANPRITHVRTEKDIFDSYEDIWRLQHGEKVSSVREVTEDGPVGRVGSKINPRRR